MRNLDQTRLRARIAELTQAATGWVRERPGWPRWPEWPGWREGVEGLEGRKSVEPTFSQRFECKYLVSPLVVPHLRDFIRPFMQADSYAALRPDGRYAVSSLYLDSDDLKLYQQTLNGEKDRFKLRVRTYSDDPSTPAYLEVKRKVNAVVHKRRVGVSRADLRKLLRDDPAPVLRKLSGSRQADAEYFVHQFGRTAARPVVRVRYMREAYAATGNEPVRVTLDDELTHAVTFDDDLGHHTGEWVATSLDRIILEIKFTEMFPWWLADLARRFQLRQRSVPKYIMSVDHMLLRGRASSLSLAGRVLPPWKG